MEGFDIRTLALTNLLLSLFLGIGSLVFAKIHNSFQGFRALGYSYFLVALGFVLFALRQYVSDFLSIIIANLTIVAGYSLLILGILKFLNHEQKSFIKISISLLFLMAIAFVYFTYFDENLNARIIIVSMVLGLLSAMAGYIIFNNKEHKGFAFIRFLGFSFVMCTIVFLVRVYFTIYDNVTTNFMNAGMVHGLSLIAMQFVIISCCFSLTICASQQLAKKLSVQATVDSLTKIYNRRAFDEFANKSISRAMREKTPISVIIMDIDLFKQVNDSFGHQIGDKVLQEFSFRLKSSLRQYDILARYGGEEFTLLLPDTDKETAMLIAEKLRDKIAQPVFFLEGDIEISVTASFGVASNQGDVIDWQQLISLADQALYNAKESGRNCVKVHKADAHEISNSKQPALDY